MRIKSVILGSMAAIAGSISFAIGYGLLHHYGPSGRVQFFDYLLGPASVNYLVAMLLGAWLAVKAYRRTRFSRFQRVVVILALVCLSIPQLLAFPSDGTAAEREEWARRHVRQYDSLVRTVRNIPAVTNDVGPIITVAPTPGDRHIAAQEMDGVGMNFKLEIIGEHGTGVLRVYCVVEGDAVYQWTPGTWTFNGKTTEIATVPNLLKPRPS
jgi:hypothetical protein